MGILNDLFGAGKQRDAAQDAVIGDLSARVRALEQAPADNGNSEALAALAARLAAIEQEFAEVSALRDDQTPDPTPPAEGGITLPEIET